MSKLHSVAAAAMLASGMSAPRGFFRDPFAPEPQPIGIKPKGNPDIKFVETKRPSKRKMRRARGKAKAARRLTHPPAEQGE